VADEVTSKTAKSVSAILAWLVSQQARLPTSMKGCRQLPPVSSFLHSVPDIVRSFARNLMRLSSLSSLEPNLVSALEMYCGIRTDTDLLFSQTPVEIHKRLPQHTTSLQQIAQCISTVIESASSPGQSAEELRCAHPPSKVDLPIGACQLDVLLGGLPEPGVIEISGEKGSGKTVRCPL